jgi:hypothetical protein
MREIRLSGREKSVVRAIGFGLGVPGLELIEQARISPEDLVDILNGLTAAGFVESTPIKETVDVADLETHLFEVNPAYAHELRETLVR